jgi:NADH dehydrogenase [ubiquinone] 1 alpha subcomplex assembly factor 7
MTPWVKLEQLEDATSEEVAAFRKSQGQKKKEAAQESAAEAAADEARIRADAEQKARAEADRIAAKKAADAAKKAAEVAAAAAARASAAQNEELQRVAAQKRIEAEITEAKIKAEEEGKARAQNDPEQWQDPDSFDKDAVASKASNCRELERLARQRKEQQISKAAEAEAEREAAMKLTPPDLVAAEEANRKWERASKAVVEATSYEAKARAEAEEHERWLEERLRREEEKKQRKKSDMVSSRNLAKGLGTLLFRIRSVPI